MTCGSCPQAAQTAMGVCAVCGQTRMVKWCDFCQANICDSCMRNPFARARAAARKVAAEIF